MNNDDNIFDLSSYKKKSNNAINADYEPEND